MVGLCALEGLPSFFLFEFVWLGRGEDDHFLAWTGHERGGVGFGTSRAVLASHFRNAALVLITHPSGRLSTQQIGQLLNPSAHSAGSSDPLTCACAARGIFQELDAILPCNIVHRLSSGVMPAAIHGHIHHAQHRTRAEKCDTFRTRH